MADLTNPVSATAAFAMKKTGDTLRNSGKQLATGQKGTGDIVSYVIGSKLRDSATVLKSVALAGQYGSKLLSVAGSELTSVKASLIELRNIIAQAAAPNTNTVANLDTMYKGRVAGIISKLANANFDSRLLFDGSLAGTGAVVAAQGIPAGASPLDIRIGEAMTNNITVSLPKLLSGIANALDAPVAGRFTPLFPTTAAGTNAGIVAAAVSAAAANLLPADPSLFNATAATNVPATNNYASIVSILLNPTTLPALTGAIIGEINNVPAALAAMNALGGANAITNNIGAILANAAAGMPNDPAGMNIQGVIDIIAASVNSFLSAGNLLTAASRTAADALIVTAIDTVTTNISAIGGQTQLLTQASDDLNTSILAIDESAHGYLDTNYEDAAKDFKTAVLALRGSISTTAQGYQVATAALSLIDS